MSDKKTVDVYGIDATIEQLKNLRNHLTDPEMVLFWRILEGMEEDEIAYSRKPFQADQSLDVQAVLREISVAKANTHRTILDLAKSIDEIIKENI